MKLTVNLAILGAATLAAPIATAAIVDPGDIAGLVLWLDANQGVTESGGSVSQWDDQSGNGNHVSQATGEWRPNLISTLTPNGSPAISFDRAAGTGGRNNDNDFLSSSALQLDNTMTAFFILAPDSLPAGQGQRFSGHYSDGQFRLDGNKASMFTDSANRTLASPTLTAGQFHTLAYRLNTTIEGSVDGSAFVQTSTVSTMSTSSFVVGGIANSFVSGAYGSFDGDIAGVIIYDAVLTDPQVADVHSYINSTYFIPEPGAFSLLALGGLGLILRRRR